MPNNIATAALAGSTKAKHPEFRLLPKLNEETEFSVTVRVRGHRHFRRIEDFAGASDLTVVRARRDTRDLALRGTAKAMRTAFSTDLRVIEINGRARRVREGDICVPAHLAPLITSVTGLDNRPFAKPHFRIAQRAAHAAIASPVSAATVLGPANASVTPPELASLYNFPAAFDGSGQRIAILELDGGFRIDEFNAYCAEIGITPPRVTVVPFPGGGANNPGTDALDPFCRDAEVMLDLQIAAGMAPGAELLVYFACDDSDEGFLNAMSAIVHDAEHKPNIVSISWGGPESTATEQFRREFDELLQTAAQLGITVCAATGDNAAPDFSSNDPRWDRGAHVDFPASSPWVLACGGTKIAHSDGKIVAEEVWFEGPHDGTGGGVSRAFALPAYQNTVGVPRAANPDGPVMRGIPDVAGNAAPASGFQILCNGQRFPDPAKNVPALGGTSAVAPLWAALIARFNQALGRNCGFLNARLYRAAAEEAGVFRNPAFGTNGSYTAALGWNACTGLGSPDGTKLLEVLRRQFEETTS